jgi:hypothetical protein
MDSQRLTSDVVQGDLESAICLLALITKRLLDEEGTEAIKNVNDACPLPGPESDESPEESRSECEEGGLMAGDDANIEDNIDEDLDEVDCLLGAGTDSEQYRAELQNKVLDRLAETLARFKSPPGRAALDRRHVCSTMMVVYEKEQKVEIVCSKNGGLDDEDTKFLGKWQACVQEIARKGKINQRLRFYVHHC